MKDRTSWGRLVRAFIAFATLGFALAAFAIASPDDRSAILEAVPSLVVAVLICSIVAVWLGMLINVCVIPSHIWRDSGHDRVLCFLLVLLLGPVGAFIFGLAVRPRLARAQLQQQRDQGSRPDQKAA